VDINHTTIYFDLSISKLSMFYVCLGRAVWQSPSTLVGLLLVVQSGSMNASNLTIIFAFRSQ